MTKPNFPFDFSFPFDYCMPMVYNGGGGGGNFNEIGPNNGIVSSLTIYMAAHRVAGIQISYVNSIGTTTKGELWGTDGGNKCQFFFQAGERMTKLTIAQASYNDNHYCGGITFETNLNNSFSALTDNHGNSKTVDVGFGLAVGISGACGEALDRLGFFLILPISGATLDITSYSPESQPTSTLALNTIYEHTYQNNGGETATISYGETFTATTEQSTTNSSSLTNTEEVAFEVKGDVFAAEVSASGKLSWTSTTESSHTDSYSTTEEVRWEVTQTIPANSTYQLTVSQAAGASSADFKGKANVKLVNTRVSSAPFYYKYYIQGKIAGVSKSTSYYTTFLPVADTLS
jgi:hypothetical protein